MSSWLTSFVRPNIRALFGGTQKPELPEHLWQQCSQCERMVFHRDLDANQHVCPHCAHHFRVDAGYRFAQLLDAGSANMIDWPKIQADPLKFRDRKKYAERLKEAQSATGKNDALDAAEGRIEGEPLVLAVMNFAFMAGSMGTGLGEGLVICAERAVAADAPLVVVTASGGARMQEGALSLMQMARSTIAVQMVKDAGLPYVVVLTDPTTGGVTASFAMLGDIHIAEPGALIGFAGPRVIEQTIRQKLPDGFQRAEYLRDHGMIDLVVSRHELRPTLANVLRLLRNRPRGQEPLALPAPADETAVATASSPVLVEPAADFASDVVGQEDTVVVTSAFDDTVPGPDGVVPKV